MEQLWEQGEKKVLKKLKFLSISMSALTTFDFSMTPSLETLILSSDCADLEELTLSSACPNLKFLGLRKSRLRSLDLELFPNLERLDLEGCGELVVINASVGYLKKVCSLDLNSCMRLSNFVVSVGGLEPKDSRSSASLRLVGKSLDFWRLHHNSNLPKCQFDCNYRENLLSSVGNIEKLISFGLCAGTDIKKFSDMICSLRCLSNLELECDIPEFSKDIGQLECLEELYVRSKKIEYLPDSICMLKRLKSLDVRDCSRLKKLPQDIGQLESLEILDLTATMIKHLPDSICELKHLKYLDLRHCTLLQKLPEDLGKLKCLEKLFVWSMKIEYLPDSICMLKHLKSLCVRNCSYLGKLPENIGQLESLESLELAGTKIKHLPDSICSLKHLKYLDLRRCALLEKLPKDIAASPKLHLWR